MALFDLLGRRGTLRVLWELRDSAPQTFRALQASTGGMSPSVLNERLKELRDAQVVDPGEGGYCLTESGQQLLVHLKGLSRWAMHWADALDSPKSLSTVSENSNLK